MCPPRGRTGVVDRREFGGLFKRVRKRGRELSCCLSEFIGVKGGSG